MFGHDVAHDPVILSIFKPEFFTGDLWSMWIRFGGFPLNNVAQNTRGGANIDYYGI